MKILPFFGFAFKVFTNQKSWAPRKGGLYCFMVLKIFFKSHRLKSTQLDFFGFCTFILGFFHIFLILKISNRHQQNEIGSSIAAVAVATAFGVCTDEVNGIIRLGISF